MNKVLNSKVPTWDRRLMTSQCFLVSSCCPQRRESRILTCGDAPRLFFDKKLAWRWSVYYNIAGTIRIRLKKGSGD